MPPLRPAAPSGRAPSDPVGVPARTRVLAAAGLLVLILVVLGAWTAGAGAQTTNGRVAVVSTVDVGLSPAKAVVLGVVEGVTEFLPISSTGHLTVVQRLLGVGDTEGITDPQRATDIKEATDAYTIVIQAGAILAVLVLYSRRLLSVAKGVIGRDDEGRRIGVALVVAFVPAGAVAFVFDKKIKEHLFGPWPVVAAWVIGGAVILGLSRTGWFKRGERGIGLEAITIRAAGIIGVAQILALWPGTSRSLVTIIAGLAVGLTLAGAVEFSFLLGLITLSAATAYDALKHGQQIVDVFGVASPMLGFVTAFVAAVVAVRWMVTYLQKHSFEVFGWYRLGIAAATVALIATNVLKV